MEPLAVTFDPNSWGTIAAWVTGVLAAAFAGLAWFEAKQAGNWAEIAAKAQQRANALTEAELVPTIDVSLEKGVTVAGVTVPAIALISIELTDNSPAPIWIRSFTCELAVLYDAEETSSWYVTDHDTHRPFDDMLPEHLLPGHKVAEPDPYHHLYEGRLLSAESLILYDVEYSYTEDGPLHSITHGTVNLNARSKVVWTA